MFFGRVVTIIPIVRVNKANQPNTSRVSPKKITPKIAPTPGTPAIIVEAVFEPSVLAAYPIRTKPNKVGTRP